MAIPINLGWTANASTPVYDQGYKSGDRPEGGGGDGSYTITGTGFGTKPMDAMTYDDFEEESVGSISSFQGDLVINGSSTGVGITDSIAYSGSKCLTHDFSANDFPKIYRPLSGTRTKAYLSCYWRYDGDVVTTEQVVWKLARIGGSNDVYDGNPKGSAEYVSSGGSDTPTGLSGSMTTSGGITTYNPDHNDASATPSAVLTNGDWHFYELEFYAGTVDGDDAEFYERIDGIPTHTFVDRPFLTTANSDLPDWFLTPINGRDGFPEVDDYVDCLMIDESRARVVMTDNATYASSTQWAVQPISAYSDTSVTVTGKRQGFTSGATAYLHIFDDDGVLVSEGNEITVEEDA